MLWKKQILRELTLFVLVGMTLFALDLGILIGLSGLSWDSSIANLLSTSIATGVAFLAHLKITFARRQVALKASIVGRYLWAVVILGIANYLISTAGIFVYGDTPSQLTLVKIVTVGLISILRFTMLRKFVYV